MRTLINTYLGQYLIIDVAGRGNMSTVYKAFQPSLNRHVAIKVLFGRLDPHSRLRFQREAQAIALLQHPNILPIYDFVQHDEIDYFVMQYVEHAVSLNDQIASGPITLAKSLQLISHVLDALDYAHSHGVIHRDIKPSNILMPREDWPVLADFGIAKMIDDSQDLTPAGQVVGTASYMAPEVMRSQPIDTRSDIYSVGIVLYEMVTGCVPFDGVNALSVLMKHVNEPLPLPSTVNPLVPPPIEAIIARALEKNPSDRYQSAAEMRAAIRTTLLQTDRSTRYTSMTQPTPVFTPVRDMPPIVAPLASATIAPAWPLSAPAPLSDPPTAHIERQQPSQLQTRALRLLVLAIAGMVAALVLLWAFPSRGVPTAGVSATATVAAIASDVAATALAKGPLPLATAAVVPSPIPSQPSSSPPIDLPTTAETYIVQPNDALSAIALRFGTTVEALLAANGINDPNLIQEGQTLIIPEPGTAEPGLLTETQLPAFPTLVPSTVPASAQQTALADGTVVLRLEDTDWQGGYRSPSGRAYGGRSATWIYGSSTEYASMHAVFALPNVIDNTATLRLEGMDSEGPAKTPIQININGTTIYASDNPLPDDDGPIETGTWAAATFDVDPRVLKQGENEIRITNLAEGAFSRPPFFMLDYAELIYTP